MRIIIQSSWVLLLGLAASCGDADPMALQKNRDRDAGPAPVLPTIGADAGATVDSGSSAGPDAGQPSGRTDGGTASAWSVGAACLSPTDCGSGSATCLQGTPSWWDAEFLGGYCTMYSCSEANLCPGDAVCVYTDESEQTTICLDSCSPSDPCRSGYECLGDGYCLPTDSGGSGGNSPIGGACASNTDCRDTGAVCIDLPGGYCSVFQCDQVGCPTGSTCYQVDDMGSTACLADCAGRSDCRAPDYACADPGACLPACDANSCPAGSVCGPDGVCVEESCVDTGCPAGLTCNPTTGQCYTPAGSGPPGPIPQCNLPEWRCTGGAAYCSEIVEFLPERGPGYWNYPLNGETANDQYRSFIRRDVMMLVKYASAGVDCLAQNWNFGNQQPLGLGDMSEANGAIPGTRDGSPGHPQGTHVDGSDMDIAYYQVTSSDNRLRSICDHYDSAGRDQYHCTSAPNNFDVWRTALFFGLLHDSPYLRVIGCDGQVGPMIESAVSDLCADGWLAGAPCRNLQLAFETTDQGRGWYRFHHHHFHISVNRGPSLWQEPINEMCLTPDCSGADHDLGPLLMSLPRLEVPASFSLRTP